MASPSDASVAYTNHSSCHHNTSRSLVNHDDEEIELRQCTDIHQYKYVGSPMIVNKLRANPLPPNPHHPPKRRSYHELIAKSTNAFQTSTGRLLRRVRLKRLRASMFTLPIPHKHGDCNWLETIANVATSVPFIWIGLQAPRNKAVTKVYANSLVGVGVASSLYHTSRGDVRKVMRWADYAMISTSALCLSRALRSGDEEDGGGGGHQWALMLASAALMPFKPALVTTIHTGITEVAFYRRANTGKCNARVQRAHKVHIASCIAGAALFIADGMLQETPFIHASWHIAAALGVATYNTLLTKNE